MSVLIGTPLDDTLTGDAGEVNTIFGDAKDVPPSFTTGGNDTLTGGDAGDNTIFGDIGSELRQAAGGDDVLIGGAGGTNVMAGDAGGDFNPSAASGDELRRAVGGDDVLIGGADGTNVMAGDAGGDFNSNSIGGRDLLIGGANAVNTMYGDARGALRGGFSGGGVTAGNDELIGGAGGENEMFGDAEGMSFIRGGDDRLTGGANGSNVLIGDARFSLQALGGNDALIAGAGGVNLLIGDFESSSPRRPGEGSGAGGNDRLISGTGDDEMWGDLRFPPNLFPPSRFLGGRDVFVFAPDNGDDIIHDFRRGEDLIDVTAVLRDLGVSASTSFAAALELAAPVGLDIEVIGRNSIIHFDDENSVTVLGVTSLSETDFLPVRGSGYVLFSRTAAREGTRDKWVGSGANSQPGVSPGDPAPRSSFDADHATGAGTVLAGAGAANYAADGVLTTPQLAMFDLTEWPPGSFPTGAPAELSARIASQSPFFGTGDSDLDPAHSGIDLATGKLHLAQTDHDWNGVKNLELSLASNTSFRDIRLENFVDTRLKIGDVAPIEAPPVDAPFRVELLGLKRGEFDASHAPLAVNLFVTVWTNSGAYQNSFDISGSIFDDTVKVEAGQVRGSRFGESESWYAGQPFGPGSEGIYLGRFTDVFAHLGAGEDSFDSRFGVGLPHDGGPFLATHDVVWGGSGDDVIVASHGADRLFGDGGSGSWARSDPLPTGRFATDGPPGNDQLDGGEGADWLEGNGDTGVVLVSRPDLILNGGFEEFDSEPDDETIVHDTGTTRTFKEIAIDNVPGWARDEPVDGQVFGGPIELLFGVNGLLTFEGGWALELDSRPDFEQNSFTFLNQAVETTPGLLYHLSFAYAPRPEAPAGSSAFDFSFNDGSNDVSQSFANDEPGWHVFEVDVVGTGFAQVLFVPRGPLDSLGALIDDVHLRQDLRTVDLSLAGDRIDCGRLSGQPFGPDFDPDVVNFNLADGFDVVSNFRPGSDVLRFADFGALTQEIVLSSEGLGLLVQNELSEFSGVFLLGVAAPLGQSVDGDYLLLS